MAQYGQKGAIPQGGTDPNANPQTWDWRPLETRDQLKRNALPRKCNDVFWAGALIVAVIATIGFGVYGMMNIDWKTDKSSDKIQFFEGDNLWKLPLSIVFASVFGIVFAWLWTCILKSCSGVMVRVSIYTYLGCQIAMIGVLLSLAGSAGMWPAIGMGIVLLIHILYFWCIWHRIPMAEATMAIAVTVMRRYSQVMWVAILACILSFAWIITWAFADYGVLLLTGMVECVDGQVRWTQGNDRNSEIRSLGPAITMFVMVLVFFWGLMAIGYIVHAICAGIMGTWYFGTSRKRTVTDAVIRACTSSLGSISFAAFIVAVIRAMEYMASSMEQQGRDDDNAGAVMIAMCLRCILSIIGDIVEYLNGLAIVRVAIYGESFCTAAKRTMQMIKYRGLGVVINDDLSGLVIWMGCCICFLITIPCLFSVYYFFPGFAIVGLSDYDTSTANGYLALMFSFCALVIPIQILTTIQSFVQSLYICWADDPKALDDTHPREAKMLKDAAYGHRNYQVKYDDKYIIVQNGAAQGYYA